MRRQPGQHHPDGHPERRFDKAQQAVHPGRQGVAALRDEQDGQQRDGRHASVVRDAEQHAQHDEQRHGEHHAERREGEEAQIGIGKQRPERRAGHAQQPRAQRLPESRRLEHHDGRGAGQHGPHAARCLVEGARDEGADKVGHHHPDAARHHHHGANPPQQSMYRRFHALRRPFWGSMQQETGRSRREGAPRPIPSPLRAGKRVGTDPGKRERKGWRRSEKEKTGKRNGKKRRPGKGPLKSVHRQRHKKTVRQEGKGKQSARRRAANARAAGHKKSVHRQRQKNVRRAGRANNPRGDGLRTPMRREHKKTVRQEGEGKQSARRRAANARAARTQKNRAAGCTLQPTARSLFHGYTAAPTHRRGGRCPQDYIQRVSIIVGLLEPPTAS